MSTAAISSQPLVKLLGASAMAEAAPVNPDIELVTRTQSGDARAFDELVVKYTPRLYGLVYNMTSNHEDANDLLQEVFAKAFRSISGFRGKSSFYTWIHSIAVNMTINFLKKRGRRFQMSLDDVDLNIQNDKEFIELTDCALAVVLCASAVAGVPGGISEEIA
jgi:DNA-directed RNA polymerase specialized sigma24 family protein